MKYLTLICTALILLCGCSGSNVETQATGNWAKINVGGKVLSGTHCFVGIIALPDGHDYAVLSIARGAGIVHAAGCQNCAKNNRTQ